jgi:hypothetical protein
MAVRLDTGVRVDYSQIFDDQPQNLSFYFSGIDRKSLLLLGVHFLQYQNRHLGSANYAEDINSVLGYTNVVFKTELMKRIQPIVKKFPQSTVAIFNTPASLIFFEAALNHTEEVTTRTDEEIRKSAIIAYLAANEQVRKNERKVYASIENLSGTKLQFIALILAQAYPYYNINSDNARELGYCQIIKAVLFYKFLENNILTQPLLQEFLKEVKESTWQSFFKRYLPIVKGIALNLRSGKHLTFTIPQGNHYQRDCEFFDQISTKGMEFEIEPDFLVVRDRPFYKVSEGVYRVIFATFAFEKIFKSLFFNLSKVNEQRDEDKRINLPSIISGEFSEEVMTYNVLNRMLKNNSQVALTGTELKSRGVKAEPDYYARNGRHVFVFESKDFRITKEVKASFDYTIIESAFKEKLYFEQKEKKIKKKAIMQLGNTINALLERTFKADDLPPKQIEIYPIIVVHDHQYNVTGLNKLANHWFDQERLNLIYTDRRDIIWPITIINIDTLIYNESLFRTSEIKLHTVIEKYHRSIKDDSKKQYPTITSKQQAYQNMLMPFSAFLSDYIKRRRLIQTMDWHNELKDDIFVEGLTSDSQVAT